MTAAVHPAAPHMLPSFITAPGETDYLLIIAGITLVGAVLGVGLLFLRLHTLPERMAHRAHKLQFEIVAVLGLLALFTHIHLFWVAGLLLALIDLPDFSGTFGRMASALETIAGKAPDESQDTGTPAAEAAVVTPVKASPESPPAALGNVASTEEKGNA
ncbi:hypothetical protein [uncultured Bosea sp.]|uniref:hypothetical protein n=1 Tax=uncultured Bosea sp. TaxID=211457 RepID=UPI00263B3F64|nr:hypothetical protein [uncultured Bosea sp.]